MTQPTINVSKFLPLVQPYAPHASDPAVMQALRKAAIEFCEQTRCWRHMIRLTISRQDYPAIAPAYAAIHEFETVTFNDDTPLTPVQFSDVEHADFSEQGAPRYITQTGPSRISILPFSDGVLDISVFLKPRHGDEYALSPDSAPENVYDTVPDFLFTLHGEVIAAGALSRLLLLPGQPFTDPKMAEYFRADFQRRAERVFNHNVRGQQRARPRILARWF